MWTIFLLTILTGATDSQWMYHYPEICAWDMFYCPYGPYPYYGTVQFRCDERKRCPRNFVCCHHECFMHHICQPVRYQSLKKKKTESQPVSEKAGECNIQIGCAFLYPQEFLKQFECQHDYACPEDYKCCFIECWKISVCQPYTKTPNTTIASTIESTTAAITLPPTTTEEAPTTTTEAITPSITTIITDSTDISEITSSSLVTISSTESLPLPSEAISSQTTSTDLQTDTTNSEITEERISTTTSPDNEIEETSSTSEQMAEITTMLGSPIPDKDGTTESPVSSIITTQSTQIFDMSITNIPTIVEDNETTQYSDSTTEATILNIISSPSTQISMIVSTTLDDNITTPYKTELSASSSTYSTETSKKMTAIDENETTENYVSIENESTYKTDASTEVIEVTRMPTETSEKLTTEKPQEVPDTFSKNATISETSIQPERAEGNTESSTELITANMETIENTDEPVVEATFLHLVNQSGTDVQEKVSPTSEMTPTDEDSVILDYSEEGATENVTVDINEKPSSDKSFETAYTEQTDDEDLESGSGSGDGATENVTVDINEKPSSDKSFETAYTEQTDDEDLESGSGRGDDYFAEG